MNNNNEQFEQDFNNQIEESIQTFEESIQTFEESIEPSYEQKWKKSFPHLPIVHYDLSEDEKNFIDNLSEYKLLSEDIDALKQIIFKIFNEKITISASCGACKSIIKSRIVKLKTFKSIQ